MQCGGCGSVQGRQWLDGYLKALSGQSASNLNSHIEKAVVDCDLPRR